MTSTKRILLPIGAGLAGAFILALIYFGIVSWPEMPKHALELFWQDRWIVIPIIMGFGIQAALYTILRLRLFVPVGSTGVNGLMLGAGGTTSTMTMLACCSHYVKDAMPIPGLKAAATFLAKYRLAFVAVGLGTTINEIGMMLYILIRKRNQGMQLLSLPTIAAESL